MRRGVRGVWQIAREEGTPDYPHSVRRVGLARVHDAINQTYISVILKISRLTGSDHGALKELMTFRCPSCLGSSVVCPQVIFWCCEHHEPSMIVQAQS